MPLCPDLVKCQQLQENVPLCPCFLKLQLQENVPLCPGLVKMTTATGEYAIVPRLSKMPTATGKCATVPRIFKLQLQENVPLSLCPGFF